MNPIGAIFLTVYPYILTGWELRCPLLWIIIFIICLMDYRPAAVFSPSDRRTEFGIMICLFAFRLFLCIPGFNGINKFFLLIRKSFLFLLLFILRIGFLCLGRQILILCNQFTDTLFHHIPVKKHGCIWLPNTSLVKLNALCIMVFPTLVISNQGIRLSACTIFFFKERYIILAVMPLLKIIIDTEKSL